MLRKLFPSAYELSSPAWILSHSSPVLGDREIPTPDPHMYPCASIHTLHLLLGTAQLVFLTLFSLFPVFFPQFFLYKQQIALHLTRQFDLQRENQTKNPAFLFLLSGLPCLLCQMFFSWTSS